MAAPGKPVIEKWDSA